MPLIQEKTALKSYYLKEALNKVRFEQDPAASPSFIHGSTTRLINLLSGALRSKNKDGQMYIETRIKDKKSDVLFTPLAIALLATVTDEKDLEYLDVKFAKSIASLLPLLPEILSLALRLQSEGKEQELLDQLNKKKRKTQELAEFLSQLKITNLSAEELVCAHRGAIRLLAVLLEGQRTIVIPLNSVQLKEFPQRIYDSFLGLLTSAESPLSLRERQALLLYFCFDGKAGATYEDLEEYLDVTPTWAKEVLMRGIAKLKKMRMEDLFGDY
jgi:hypothetical protein